MNTGMTVHDGPKPPVIREMAAQKGFRAENVA